MSGQRDEMKTDEWGQGFYSAFWRQGIEEHLHFDKGHDDTSLYDARTCSKLLFRQRSLGTTLADRGFPPSRAGSMPRTANPHRYCIFPPCYTETFGQVETLV